MSRWIVIKSPNTLGSGEICKFCDKLVYNHLGDNPDCYINPDTKKYAHIKCLQQIQKLKRMEVKE